MTLGPVTDVEADGEPIIGAPLTLAAARQLAVGLHRERALGKDIVAVRHREKLELKAKGAKTFGQAVVDFIEQHDSVRRAVGKRQRTCLAFVMGCEPKGLADRWRDRPVTDINGDDIFGVVEEAREHGVPGLERRNEVTRAKHERGQCSPRCQCCSVGSWISAGFCVNPCTGISRPEAPAARDRVLKDAELVKFWKAAKAERIEFAAPLKLLALTGCRLNEVVAMRHSELSEDGATWIIPSTRTKTGREHVVPLPRAARDILASIKTEGDIVFTTNGRTPVVIGSKIKNRTRRGHEERPVASSRSTFSHGRNRHGRDRHTAAHCRGGTQPYEWCQGRCRRCL